jgi:hypothetical protein
MKRSAILITLIALFFHAVPAQSLSLKAQPEHEQLMLRIQREAVDPSMRDLMEIREYTHPLLKKYLPDYKFYMAYVPAHSLKSPIDSDGNKKETEILLEAAYLNGLGVVDRENRFSFFSNRQEPFLDLGRAFLKNANVTRSASSRAAGELKEIASMYLILSCLKGLNGNGLLWLTEAEAPYHSFEIVRYVRPEEFTLSRMKNGVTASYKIDNNGETLECSLTFDLNGNVTAGKAYQFLKFQPF